jgi:pimeloyl-ACP methyl ester carboxylesterase
MARIEPFTLKVDEAVLADLRARIKGTRWPDQIPGIGWQQGTELEYLRGLLEYWADGFDWAAQQQRLNAFQQYTVDIGPVTVHCVHERAANHQGIPLILSHGWPSCFVELLPLVPLLTDPAKHGLPGPAFDVVIPSMPGYGFTPRPLSTGITYRWTARRWHELMAALGYPRYGAGGGDFGAGVASYVAVEHPDAVIGLHLTTPELSPVSQSGPTSPAELRYHEQIRAWSEVERGYSAIQSSKPQTVGYGLTDSPAGLAAWLLEKWRSWTDSGGDLDATFGRDFLLTLLTIYWVSGSVTATLRDYWDNRWAADPLGPDEKITVPTAFAVFDHQFVPEGEPPREWLARLYEVKRYTIMPRGGHFAPAEHPRLVAADIAAFFAEIIAAEPGSI